LQVVASLQAVCIVAGGLHRCGWFASWLLLLQDECYMTGKPHTMTPDLLADPFGERSRMPVRRNLQLLGGRFQFESNSPELMRLVDSAYADLPRHRLSAVVPQLRVRLQLGRQELRRGRSEPPPLSMLSGVGFLGGAMNSSNFVVLSPSQRAALVVVSREQLRFPYHTRYEYLEFAVFTLASRSQGLVSLHAACVGRGGRGILLMGPSGSGKSTVTLLCLLNGFDILSEDSVFVKPDSLLATGVSNFLHIRFESLRWVRGTNEAAAIRKSPVIRRRSGVAKFEVDLRRGTYPIASAPLKVAAVVFLSAQSAGDRAALKPLSRTHLREKLAIAQAYAANQPGWTGFTKRVRGVDAFELHRGRHPLETVEILSSLV
jgi:hypothetical protein